MTYKNGIRIYKQAECVNCHQVRFIAAHGLCRTCYGRERLNGTLEYKPKRVRATCIEQGCGDPVVSHGRCEKHRIRNRGRTTVVVTPSETPGAIYQRKWRAEQKAGTRPEYHRNNSLKKSFGITLDQYNEMLEKQGGVCAICGRGDRRIHPATGTNMNLAVDHCHKSDKVRGLLCSHCNHGLGNFGDDPSLLRAAADYLEEKHETWLQQKEKAYARILQDAWNNGDFDKGMPTLIKEAS